MRNLLLTIMLLGAVSVFLLFWLSPPEAFLQKPNDNIGDGEALPKADSYMLNISKIDYAKDGTKAFSLKSIEAHHFKRGNRLVLEKPKLISYNQKDAKHPWHMNAKKGTVLKGGERAIFTGDVYAWQNLDNDAKNELRTDKLILFPEERTAETDKKVTITTPKGNTVGVGMHADLNKELFKLLSRVKGIHNVN